MVDDQSLLEQGKAKGQGNYELQMSMGGRNQPYCLKLDSELCRIGSPGGYMRVPAFLEFLQE